MPHIHAEPMPSFEQDHRSFERRSTVPTASEALPLTQVASPDSVMMEEWSAITKDLVETLPRVWTRGLLYFLILIASILLPWAMLSKVDETGSARGRLEPQGKTIRIDASVSGKVTDLRIKEGQTVKAGQVLVQLESDITRADVQQAQAKLDGLTIRISQLEAMKNELEIAMRSQRLQSQAQSAAQLAQVDQTEQRLAAGRRAYDLAQDRWQRDRTEVNRYELLLKEGVVPAAKVAEMQRMTDDSRQAMEQATAEMQQASSGIKQQRSTLESVVRTGELNLLENQRRIKEIQSQISATRSEQAQIRKQIQALQFQLRQHTIKSPTNGTVFSVALDNAGTVLQPGQAIAQIAPKQAKLIFRAQMPSQESGFLKVGLPVKLKFDAYPFQDYGIVNGKVRWISPDSKVVDTGVGKIETYELEVVVDKPYIQAKGKRVYLAAGQTATAEVIVRERRVIDFILDPFKQLQKDGLNL